MRGIRNSKLEIISADYSAGGLYKCEGRNKFGVQEVIFEVKIFGKHSYFYNQRVAYLKYSHGF